MKPCANFDQTVANQSSSKEEDFSWEDKKGDHDKIFCSWDESHHNTKKTILNQILLSIFDELSQQKKWVGGNVQLQVGDAATSVHKKKTEIDLTAIRSRMFVENHNL